MTSVHEGNLYKNRQGDIVKIVKPLIRSSDAYKRGFRYLDDKGRTYKKNGHWGLETLNNPFDLIEYVGVQIDVRRTYETREGEIVSITHLVPQTDRLYEHGFRFVCTQGRYYRANGSRGWNRICDPSDIVLHA